MSRRKLREVKNTVVDHFPAMWIEGCVIRLDVFAHYRTQLILAAPVYLAKRARLQNIKNWGEDSLDHRKTYFSSHASP